MMKYKYSSPFHNSLSVKINIHEISPISEYNDTGARFNIFLLIRVSNSVARKYIHLIF